MTTDHLSLDELAELDEGLLPPERTSTVRAHLHGCAPCRARAEAIVSTRSMLAGLPPVSMPADVRARLEQAIAQEASADEVTTSETRPVPVVVPPPRTDDLDGDDGPDEPATPIVDTTKRSADVTPTLGVVTRPGFGRPTLAASAAAASVVLAIGAIIVAHYHHGHSATQPSIAAGPAGGAGAVISAAQPRNFIQSSTGRNYTTANLTADVQNLIAAPAPTTAASPSGSPTSGGSSTSSGGAGSSGGSAGQGAAGHPGASNGPTGKSATRHGTSGTTVGTPKAPAPETGGALSGTGPTTAPTKLVTNQPVPKALQPLAGSRRKILACAATLAGQRNAVPLAVDFGRWTNATFHRAPAAIFIFKGGNPSNVAVYVVPPSCDGTVDQFTVVPLPS